MSVDDLAPLRVIAITNMTSREIVFGVHIHNGMDSIEADEVSTDQVVRAYIAEFCDGCFFRSNKLDRVQLDNDFEGTVCIVAEDKASFTEYSISVKRLFSADREFWWWMNKLHSDGGWADQLAFARTGASPWAEPEPPQDQYWDNFWKAYGDTVLFSTLVAIVVFALHTMTDAFSDKEG